MTLVRLLLVVEPRSTRSVVRSNDLLDGIHTSGGAVETTNRAEHDSFIAIAAWSDWGGLDEWWSSAKTRAHAADQTIRGLIIDPTPHADQHEWCDLARQAAGLGLHEG